MSLSTRSIGDGIAIGLLAAIAGCNSETVRDGNVAPAYSQFRNFAHAYVQATGSLNRPPNNAEELKPFLAKFGNADELLRSPADGAPLVVCWGVDVAKLTSQNNRSPIWVYEPNSHSGKRWALKERNPVELTEADFAAALFAPGFK